MPSFNILIRSIEAGKVQHQVFSAWVTGVVRRVSSCCVMMFAAMFWLFVSWGDVTAAPAQRNGAAYERTVLEIQQRIQSGDLDGARVQLTPASKQYLVDGGLENLLGVVEIQQGHIDAAEKAFSQAILHSPRLIGAHLNLGRLYVQNPGRDSQSHAKAMHAYERALALSPSNAEANYQAAVLLMKAQGYARSLAYIARLDATARTGTGALAVVCADHVALGHKETAEHTAATLADNRSLGEADVVVILPVLLSAQRADLATVLLTAAAEHEPLSPAGLRALGLAQEASGKLNEARSTLERAAVADSKSTAILVDLARVAHTQKDYQGSLGYLAHARDIEPENAALPYYFGLVSLDMSLLGESRNAFAEAARMEPENPAYNFAMGTVSSFAQDPTLALPYLQKYHSSRQMDAAGILALGTTYFRAKDFETATTWLKLALKDAKTAATAHFYLGRIARQQGQLDAAVAELNEAIASTKQDRPEVFAELGQTYFQLRKYPEAEKQFDHAIRLDADNYVANFGLLQLYARTKDARLDAQSKHFDEIKNESQTHYQDMMRIIEIRPQPSPAP